MRALAKAIQMARLRSRRSPECGGMMVAGVMAAVWVVVMSPAGWGSGGLAGIGMPSRVLNVNAVPVVVMVMFLSWTRPWWRLHSEIRLARVVWPPLAQ